MPSLLCKPLPNSARTFQKDFHSVGPQEVDQFLSWAPQRPCSSPAQKLKLLFLWPLSRACQKEKLTQGPEHRSSLPRLEAFPVGRSGEPKGFVLDREGLQQPGLCPAGARATRAWRSKPPGGVGEGTHTGLQLSCFPF